jgi:hypothetical protein
MRGVTVKLGYLVAVALFLLAGLLPQDAQGVGQSACWSGDRPARIWPEIIVNRAADLGDYRKTMAQSRDEVRQMLEQVFLAVLRELAGTGVDPREIVEPVLSAVLAFDEVHDRHKDSAARGMPVFLEVGLRSALGQLSRTNRIPRDQRQIQFVNLSLVNRLKSVRKTLHSKHSVEEEQLETLQRVAETVDFVPYVTFSADGSRHLVTLTLENVRSGGVCDFEATGPLEEVTYLLAEEVFRGFQAVEYQAVRNPNPHLEWIRPSTGEPIAAAENAWFYCSSQGDGVRLPYALELITAAQVGAEGASYVEGGIPRLTPGLWVVADRLHNSGQYYYHQPRPGRAENHPNGPIRTDAGLGRVKAQYWCVKGEPDARVARIESLYELYRTVSRADVDSPVLAAIEYLLNDERALGAKRRHASAFPGVATAWAVVQDAGCAVGWSPTEGPLVAVMDPAKRCPVPSDAEVEGDAGNERRSRAYD